MHGNVGELVQDGWDSESYAESQEHAAIDPLNPYRDGSLLVVRGGWLWNDHVSCSSSTRANIHPSDRFSHVGFRVVLPVDAVKEVIKRKLESDPKLGQHDWPADAPARAIAPPAD